MDNRTKFIEILSLTGTNYVHRKYSEFDISSCVNSCSVWIWANTTKQRPCYGRNGGNRTTKSGPLIHHKQAGDQQETPKAFHYPTFTRLRNKFAPPLLDISGIYAGDKVGRFTTDATGKSSH